MPKIYRYKFTIQKKILNSKEKYNYRIYKPFYSKLQNELDGNNTSNSRHFTISLDHKIRCKVFQPGN